MRETWSAAAGRLIVTGSFDDVTVHQHPVVQIAVGLDGPVEVTASGGHTLISRVAVVATGARHAFRAGRQTTTLSVYLRPGCVAGAVFRATCRSLGRRGIWVPPHDSTVADETASVVSTSGLSAAADFLVLTIQPSTDCVVEPIHPQLGQAIDVVEQRVPHRVDLSSVAWAVGLSPDYLGRLFTKQTGASFSATARWLRLLAGLEQMSHGASITDAAHHAGFADGAHATRVCREFAGIAPSEVARALSDPPVT